MLTFIILNVVMLSFVIRHLWQLQIVILLHGCLICAVQLVMCGDNTVFNLHMIVAGNTKEGSITALLTSCLTGLD